MHSRLKRDDKSGLLRSRVPRCVKHAVISLLILWWHHTFLFELFDHVVISSPSLSLLRMCVEILWTQQIQIRKVGSLPMCCSEMQNVENFSIFFSRWSIKRKNIVLCNYIWFGSVSIFIVISIFKRKPIKWTSPLINFLSVLFSQNFIFKTNYRFSFFFFCFLSTWNWLRVWGKCISHLNTWRKTWKKLCIILPF